MRHIWRHRIPRQRVPQSVYMGGDSGPTDRITDTVSGGFCAWSLRLVALGAEENIVEVYEDGLGTYTFVDIDITSADGNGNYWIDETAIAAHCTTNNGRVRTYKDQLGTANLTQTVVSYMPYIYDGAAVTKENGKPCLSSGGTTSNHNISMVTSNTAFGQDAAFTCFEVSTNSGDGFGNAYSWVTGAYVRANYNAIRYQISDGITTLSGSSGDTPINSHNQITTLFNDASSKIRCNGTECASGSSGTPAIGTTTIRIMNDANAGNDGCVKFQELLMFAGDKTSDFSTVESDQDTAMVA